MWAELGWGNFEGRWRFQVTLIKMDFNPNEQKIRRSYNRLSWPIKIHSIGFHNLIGYWPDM